MGGGRAFMPASVLDVQRLTAPRSAWRHHRRWRRPWPRAARLPIRDGAFHDWKIMYVCMYVCMYIFIYTYYILCLPLQSKHMGESAYSYNARLM